MPMTDDFYQIVKQVETSDNAVYAGDAEPMKALWSHSDDVTIFGGWGAYEKGWEQVGPRMDWAVECFREGHGIIEPLAMGMSGDLAYLVYLERGKVRVVGHDELRPMTLRVTHLNRCEEGTWKIIHRHGDTITEKIEAVAVLQDAERSK